MRRSIIYLVLLIFTISVANSSTYIKGPALIEDSTSTATAGGTTSLTKDSQTNQIFTGATTQTVKLPNATTIPEGRRFYISNQSSGAVNVTDNGDNGLRNIKAGDSAAFRLIDNATSDGVWDVENNYTTIDLASEVTGILGLSFGGTNKNITPTNNAFVYSDTDSFELLSPALSGVAGWNSTGAVSSFSTSTTGQVLRYSGADISFGALDLADSDATTNLLPLNRGGTNKNMTASAGSVTYSDADSLELSAVGTSGQALISGGTGAPTWFAPTAGSVLFAGTSGILSQDNTNFFWDDTNNRLGIGLDASENTVVIGGTTFGSTLSVHTQAGADGAEFSIHRHSNTAALGSHIINVRSRGTESSETIVQSGDFLSRYDATGFDGTDYEIAAQIDAVVDGTPGSNDMPGRLVFLTTPDGSATPSERMRINNAGLVSIGGSAPTASAKLDIQGTDGALLIPRLTTTERDALTATAGMIVYNTTLSRFDCYVAAWGPCGGGRSVSSDLTLTASDTIAISTSTYNETYRVQANSGAITMSSTPFGSTDPIDGYRITLIGNSDNNPVTINENDAANGCVGGSVTLGKYDSAMWEYNSSLDRFVLISHTP